jgi:hypothetical protein
LEAESNTIYTWKVLNTKNEKYFSIKSNKLKSTKLVCLLGFVFPRPGIFKAGLLVGCYFNKQGCLARGEKQGGPTENKN